MLVVATASKTRINLFDHARVSRRLEIANNTLQIGLPHPGHHRSEIDAGLQVSRRKGRPKLVEPELVGIQLGFPSVAFESTQHVFVTRTVCCAEDQRVS